MSKMTETVKNQRVNEKPANAVENFMGGTSYTLNPIETLKLITASSIFGEPKYYRKGEFAEAGISDGIFFCHCTFTKYLFPMSVDMESKTTSKIMEEVIDKALDYDFEAAILWAKRLRNEFYMRLNPQIIMVRAANHKNRVAYTAEHPGEFARINNEVMRRADEPASQLTYYLFDNGCKNNIPGILKRSWAKKLESLSARDIYKYRNTGIGMIDTVRVCHANSPVINELMSTGTVEITEDERTWENMRASGKSWEEIISTIKLPHMALLRNLRNIFTEIADRDVTEKLLSQLKDGVVNGKQFPFRYKTAYDMISDASVHNKILILDTLEECIDIACNNMPKLTGKTCCLSDNSGSAWGTLNSEYGSVTVAEIDNLSSVITAKNSDEGYVGKFGDKLFMIPVSHRNGVLAQTETINDRRINQVGENTECGIWLFFKQALQQKEHWDNIFIYSDMQAGHGGLYVTESERRTLTNSGYGLYDRYVDVAKLIADYRKTVNPKVNVFCVQTAGYDNVLVPENGYRTTILTGWTGKELVYADTVNKFWDEFDLNRKCEKNASAN